MSLSTRKWNAPGAIKNVVTLTATSTYKHIELGCDELEYDERECDESEFDEREYRGPPIPNPQLRTSDRKHATYKRSNQLPRSELRKFFRLAQPRVNDAHTNDKNGEPHLNADSTIKPSSTCTTLNVAEWNIRHDHLRLEDEIKQILTDQNIAIMFLTETDSREIRNNFKIWGFDTFYPLQPEPNDKVRIVCLVRQDPEIKYAMRDDLMSAKIPTIWVEYRTNTNNKFLIGGCYREWTNDGDDSIDGQKKRMSVLVDQINMAYGDCGRVVMVGDMNLCTTKWDEGNYRYKSIAEPLRTTLTTNNLQIANLGLTYFPDHPNIHGEYVNSARMRHQINGDLNK